MFESCLEPFSQLMIAPMVLQDIGSVILVSVLWTVHFTHCLLTYNYKGYAGRVDWCICVNIKATIKANRVITVTAIAGNPY